MGPQRRSNNHPTAEAVGEKQCNTQGSWPVGESKFFKKEEKYNK
jgi:hypothetical protein